MTNNVTNTTSTNDQITLRDFCREGSFDTTNLVMGQVELGEVLQGFHILDKATGEMKACSNVGHRRVIPSMTEIPLLERLSLRTVRLVLRYSQSSTSAAASAGW